MPLVIWYLISFRKSVEKILVTLKSYKNNGYCFMETNKHVWSYLAQFVLKWKMFRISSVENIKTHNLGSIKFFFGNCAFYEETWKNILEPSRPRMTIWHKLIACWIRKATDTHSEYVIFLFFHNNNGCTKASPYYVTCTAIVLFKILQIN